MQISLRGMIALVTLSFAFTLLYAVFAELSIPLEYTKGMEFLYAVYTRLMLSCFGLAAISWLLVAKLSPDFVKQYIMEMKKENEFL